MCFVLAFAVVGTPTYAVHDAGVFELDTRAGVDGDQDKKNDPIPAIVGDGNTADDAAAGEDWENVYIDWNGGAASSAFAISFIEDTFANGNIDNGAQAFVIARTPEDSFFTGGGSKDTNGIQDGPWQYKVESDQVPDKNDIVNAFAAAYSDPNDGHTILYFGMDTYSVNGDSNAGFWFFRNDVTRAPLEPGANTGSFIGEHADGDIFVAVAYTEGGTVGDIDVYEWIGDDATGSLVLQFSSQGCETGGADVDGDGDDDVCGVINKLLPDQTFGEDPLYDYANTLVANNPLAATSYQHESAAFVEFGLDLNAVLGEDIGCFSTFMAESRSSQSETAQLKDFALGSFDLCGLAVTKQCEAELNAAGTAADVTFSGTTTNSGAVMMTTTLSDNASGSVFDKVCIDTSGDGLCLAADGEAVPGNLTGLNTQTVSFDHNSGETIAYEGHYTALPPFVDDLTGGGAGFDFTDTVTASGVFGSDTVGPETATAICSAVGTADIQVTKSCTNAAITGGNTFVADISGTVSNTGNVKLDNVSFMDVTDSGAAAGAYTVLRADLSAFPTDGSGSLAPGEVLTFSAAVSSTTQTDHANTITWSGENTFDASDVATDSASAPSGAEVCSVNPIPNILITKDCAPAGVDLGFNSSGTLTIFVNTAIQLTNNGTDENLVNVSVGDPEGGLVYSSGVPSFTCNADGTSCAADGPMAPGAMVNFTQQYNPDTTGVDILGNLDEPDTVSFYNKASTSGTGSLSGIPVGDMDDTDCPLCQ
ncbi:hypothetical protein GCM10027217_46410 [Pseudomaricurvus hydrocarbonicus]